MCRSKNEHVQNEGVYQNGPHWVRPEARTGAQTPGGHLTHEKAPVPRGLGNGRSVEPAGEASRAAAGH
jgi:hypothetical protein